MNWKKSVVAFIVFISMVAGNLPAKGVITSLVNKPTPNTAGANAAQTIRFLNTDMIPNDGRIEITFPSGFNLNAGGDWTKEDVYLNFQKPCQPKNVYINGQKLIIVINATDPILGSGTGFQEIHINFLPPSTIPLVPPPIPLPPNNKLTNPPVPGLYTISLSTYNAVGTIIPGNGTVTSTSFEIVSNMTQASVIPEPNMAGALAKYTIRFKIGSGSSRSLYAGDYIEIGFDSNLIGPDRQESNNKITNVPGTIKKECVTINGSLLNVDPLISQKDVNPEIDARKTIKIVLPQNVLSQPTSGADITIIFNSCANITNPTQAPWSRNVTISTHRNNTDKIEPSGTAPSLDSNTYLIQTSLSSPSVLVRPDKISVNAEYHIIVLLGTNGSLQAQSGRVDVTFPEGTVMPGSISSSSIKIGIINLPSDLTIPNVCEGILSPPFEPQVSGNKVSFVVPQNAAAGKYLCITFSTSAGIINPSTPGSYFLKFSTSSEPSIVTSAPYYINSTGRVIVTVNPNQSNEKAEYRILFTSGANGALYPFGTPGNNRDIFITFPNGFSFPVTPIPAGSIRVNGISVPDAITPTGITSKTLRFSTPVVIESNSMVEIVILKVAEITNPSIKETPQYYSVKVETDKEKDLNSDQFKIETWITDLDVTVEDHGASMVSRYEVSFTTGDVDDNLKPGSTINFEFPSGTIIPPYISTGNVQLSAGALPITAPASILVMGQKVLITLPLSFTVPQLVPVRVVFLSSCGIRNPDVPGAYRINGLTSVETIPQSSNLYTIGSIAGNVQIKVEPNITNYCSSPDGAKYTVRFTTGVTGGLSNRQNVHVVFPPEYNPGYMPVPFIPAGRITINGIVTMANALVSLATAPFPVGSRDVTIPLPVSIDSNSTIEIVFLPSANIDNPLVLITPQPFFLSVYTDSEPSPSNGIYYLVSAVSGIAPGCNVPVNVALSSHSANNATGMDVQFKLGTVGTLTAGVDKVNIKLPPETKIPNFISGSYITMKVNDALYTGSKSVLNPSIADNTISFIVPFGLNVDPIAGSNIYIFITQGAGIVNPSTPGNYHLMVSTSREITEVLSNEYYITYVGTSKPSVTVIPNFANAEATYTIKFYTGSYGGINIGDPIHLQFQPAYTIPDDTITPIIPQSVTVNGSPCSLPIESSNTTKLITIYSPAMIAGNSAVNIVFSTAAKIRNPLAPANYSISLWTLRDGSPGNPFISYEYEIISATRPTVSTVSIDPCTPYTNALYTFTFYTPVGLTANTDSFVFNFPTGTFIPSTISANTILFGTQQCQTNPVVSLYSVRVFPPVGIGANASVTITFTADAGLQNPAAGSYTVDVKVDAPGGLGTTGSHSYFVCADLDFGRIEILPAGTRIQLGKSQVFTARTFDTNGLKMDTGVIYRWNVSGGIGNLDNVRLQSPEFYARNMGSGNISVIASYGNKTISASVNIVVLGSIGKIVLTPNQVTTSRGKKTHFIVQSFDTNDEILEQIQYDWSLTPTLGKITKIGNGGEVEFLAEAEGECVLSVSATQSAVVMKETALIEIKNGVNSLKFQPDTKTEIAQPSELIGPFTIQLLNETGMNFIAKQNVIVQLISSSFNTRFSLDGITWSKGNTLFVDVSQNFSETIPFYISEIEANNISIIASSSDYNSTVLSLSIRGVKKIINITTPPQTLRISKPSGPIKIQFMDLMGNPYSLKNDTSLILHSNSGTGTFSNQLDPWNPVKALAVTKANSSVEFYYQDSREGTYTFTVSSSLFGSVSQMISISSPGAVTTPEVTVTPSVNSLKAQYNIKFSIGVDGELRMGSDTITVQFPDGTVLPPNFSSEDITINGLSLLRAPLVSIEKFKLSMEVPTNLNAGTAVEIVIRNVINPATIGEYYLQVNTSTQPSPSTSKPYRIDVSSVSNITVVTKPIMISSIAEYQIKFRTGLKGSLIRGDTIFILFDYATSLPKEIKKENVLINGFSLDKDPQVDGKIITITAQRDYPADFEINLLFKAECEIKNPAFAGMYKVKVFTIKEQAMVESEPYEIVQNSIVKNVKIKPIPATVTSNGEYTIEFLVGPYGALAEEDFIYLVLSDLILPKTISPVSISINNIRLTKNPVISDKTIKIPVPQFINNSSTVIIVLYRGAGISNPVKPADDYRISVFTSKENLPVISETFTIEPAVIINYVLTPSEPDGFENWYITAPKLIFTTNVAGTIYYRIDSNLEQTYSEPITLSTSGWHEVTYRCVSLLGSESSFQSFTYKFDGDNPVIETNLKEDTYYTKSDVYALTVRIRDIAKVKLFIDEKEVALIENSFSSLLSLKDGENLIMIRASDEAGNLTTIYKKIIVKTNPPILLVTSPALFQLVENVYFATTPTGSELYANIRFAGSAELGIDSLKIVSQTTGFITELQLDFMGNFDRTIGIKSMAGDNVLSITAVDKVGNETRIVVSYIVKTVLRLRIGNATAFLNGNPVQLEVKPYLKYNQFTMVPFRLIAESIGATIVWDASARRVTYDFRGIHVELIIGSKKAIVRDATGRTKNVILQAEPELLGGRTQVPLRFVSEALGAKVGWDGKLWEASVSYP